MAYERELKFRVRLNVTNGRLLPVTRDGRDYSANFTVHSMAGPRLAPVRGTVRVGVSGSLLAAWSIQSPSLVEMALRSLAVSYLISRIGDGAITGTEELQLTTYNALGIERPAVEEIGPQRGPFDVAFSRWVRV